MRSEFVRPVLSMHFQMAVVYENQSGGVCIVVGLSHCLGVCLKFLAVCNGLFCASVNVVVFC